MTTPRRPTLRDVAEIANVSEMTASRVLRGKGEASEKTKERVLLAAKEVGYVPNKIAGSLSSQSVNLVAVVIPSISSFVFSQVLTGISEVLEPSGLNPVFGLTNYYMDTEEDVIRDMLSWRPAGLIVAGLEHSEVSRKMLRASGIPIVEIMDVDGDPVDMNVGISHRKAGYEMGRLIVAKGHRKLGFVGTKLPLDFRAAKRFEGFQKAIVESSAQIVDEEFYSGASSMGEGRKLTQEMLARTPDLDCIYYSSDMMSAGGLMHCLANDISVPDQLALAGFNGLEFLEGLPIQLATSSALRYEVGSKAASMILSAIENHDTMRGQRQEFEARLIQGQSL